jgi:hypothetical protein
MLANRFPLRVGQIHLQRTNSFCPEWKAPRERWSKIDYLPLARL